MSGKASEAEAKQGTESATRYYVTVRGFGHIKSFYVTARNEREAEAKGMEDCGVSVEVEHAPERV
jgi:hypothetical protein